MKILNESSLPLLGVFLCVDCFLLCCNLASMNKFLVKSAICGFWLFLWVCSAVMMALVGLSVSFCIRAFIECSKKMPMGYQGTWTTFEFHPFNIHSPDGIIFVGVATTLLLCMIWSVYIKKNPLKILTQ